MRPFTLGVETPARLEDCRSRRGDRPGNL